MKLSTVVDSARPPLLDWIGSRVASVDERCDRSSAFVLVDVLLRAQSCNNESVLLDDRSLLHTPMNAPNDSRLSCQLACPKLQFNHWYCRVI